MSGSPTWSVLRSASKPVPVCPFAGNYGHRLSSFCAVGRTSANGCVGRTPNEIRESSIMCSAKKFAAMAVLAASCPAFGALVIDDFSTTSLLSKSGVGTVSQAIAAPSALGGERFETTTVTTGGGTAISKVNNPLTGIAAMSSETGVNAIFNYTYGNSVDLNAVLVDNSFFIRVLKSDIGSLNNSMTVTTTGVGSATATFVVPALVGLGGPTAPFDILIPFNTFTGAAVDFGNIDKISYSFNPSDSADWQVQLFGTAVVPEPTSMALLVPAVLMLARRTRA